MQKKIAFWQNIFQNVHLCKIFKEGYTKGR